MTNLNAPISFLTIVIHGGRLYGVSRLGGDLYPLYIYGPLYTATQANTPYQAIPLLHEWAPYPYVADFVANYMPLPVVFADLANFVAVNIEEAESDESAHAKENQMLNALAQVLPQYFLPTALRGALSVQSRMPEVNSSRLPEENPVSSPFSRPWAQTTYRGYPLYYVSPGLRADEAGDHPTMFISATVDIEPRESAQGGVTWPPIGIGP